MRCSVCHHPRRDEIDEQLLRGVAYRIITAATGLSLGALSRHRQHVKEMIGLALKDRSAGEVEEHGHALVDRAEELLREAQSILSTAKSKGDLRAATGAVMACVRVLELVGRADGTLQGANSGGIHFHANKTVNINVQDSDLEVALLVGEATGNFSTDEFMRLKQIASSTAVAPEAENPT